MDERTDLEELVRLAFPFANRKGRPMTIYLRTVTDSHGDAVDYKWYCRESCYRESLDVDPVSETLETGGAYPCGAEADGPDFCATCGEPIGNPLTPEGHETVREWLNDVPFRLDPTGTLAERAQALRRTYGL